MGLLEYVDLHEEIDFLKEELKNTNQELVSLPNGSLGIRKKW